jgi:hypothetical protein
MRAFGVENKSIVPGGQQRRKNEAGAGAPEAQFVDTLPAKQKSKRRWVIYSSEEFPGGSGT